MPRALTVRRMVGGFGAMVLVAGCTAAVTATRGEDPPVVLMMASTIGPIAAGIVDALVIRANPARFPRVNAAETRRFLDWLVSEDAQRLIQSFGVSQYGELLFFPNSAEWRRRHPAG